MSVFPLTTLFCVLFSKTAILGDFLGGKVFHHSILFERLGPTYDFRPLKLTLFGVGRT